MKKTNLYFADYSFFIAFLIKMIIIVSILLF